MGGLELQFPVIAIELNTH